MADTLTQSSGLSVPVTFGPAGGLNLGGVGFGVNVTFGAGSLSATLSGNRYGGISVEVTFGEGAIIETDAAGAAPPYTIFASGVNIAQYVKKPSITRHLQMGGGSRGTLRFITHDIGGGYCSLLDGAISIYEGSEPFFRGFIDSTDEMWYSGTSGLNEVEVNCSDYGIICDRRLVAKYYTLFMGGIPSITVADIAENFLDGTGVYFDPTGCPGGPDLGEQLFNYCTVTEALNQIADKANTDWFVSPSGVLRMFAKATGWGVAPYTISDDDGNFLSMRVRKHRTRRVNRQGVRTTQMPNAIWSDTVTAVANQMVVETTYLQEVKPVVTLNGIQQIVVPIADIGTKTWDFYYIPNGLGVFPKTALNVGDQVIVWYPSKLPMVFWAEDAASIALHGRWEAVEEVRDVPLDVNAMNAIAAGKLARANEDYIEATIVSRKPGWLPGQLVTVNTTQPPLVATLVIQSVDSLEVVENGQPKFEHTITAISSETPVTNRADTFFAKIIERTKIPIDRISYHIGFTLAETVEGVTNPGLSVGEKQAIRTAPKDGVLRDVVIYFKSVDAGTLTTSDIEIDVYQNGTSIFAANDPLVFPAGATSLERKFIFSTNPFRIYKGDVFTFEVLTADSAAKDGFVELTVMG